MASESTKDPILDLLFEELDSEERTSLRSEIEGDPEQAAELEGFESFLTRVRDADMVEEVPNSVHDVIMEAARAGAVRGAGQRPSRRGPREGGSIWNKMGGNTGQIALVATVLVAAAFVFQVVGQQGSPSAVGDSAEAPLSEMVMEREAAEPMVAQSEPEASDDFAADRGDEVPNADLEAWEPTDENKPLELAAKPEEEVLPGAREKAERPRTTSKSTAKTRSSRRSPNKANKASDNLEDLLRSNSGSLFGGESAEYDAVPSKGSGVTSTATDKSAEKKKDSTIDYIAPEEDLDAPAQEPVPQAAAAEGEAQQAYEPPSGSPSSIQQTYDSRDYNRTIAEANDYLAEGDGNSTDNATVMQLKAQSLVNLGRFSEADRIYASIQQAYPSFRPDQITQARAEISRRQQQNKAPKRKAKPSPKKKQSIDFSDDMLESESPSSY